jgi:hypothetical protein
VYRHTFFLPRHWLEVSGELNSPAALTPGNGPPVPIRGLSGPQSRSGRDEVKILNPTGTRIPIPRSSSPWPVAVPTALSRPYKNKKKKTGRNVNLLLLIAYSTFDHSRAPQLYIRHRTHGFPEKAFLHHLSDCC